MRKLLPTFILLAALSACSHKESKLPKTWTSKFKIKLYSGGGMEDAAINVDFRYDSCVFVTREGRTNATITFPMTEAYRTEVLEKMKDFDLDEIRTEKTDMMHDKETSQICYGDDTKESCIDDGASIAIHANNREDFFGAYQYLLTFAKTRK